MWTRSRLVMVTKQEFSTPRTTREDSVIDCERTCEKIVDVDSFSLGDGD